MSVLSLYLVDVGLALTSLSYTAEQGKVHINPINDLLLIVYYCGRNVLDRRYRQYTIHKLENGENVSCDFIRRILTYVIV